MSRPSILRLATEVAAVGEIASFPVGARVIRKWLPRGNRPVFVMPGFLGSDGSTIPVRRALRRLGHTTYAWEQGRNLGPTPDILDGASERITQLAEEHGPIDIVGYSLGGIYAREMARVNPETIRQVITLGSPFQIETPDQSNVAPIYDALSSRHARSMQSRVPAYIREPLPVPATSIYTRADGVVRWHHCLNHDQPHTENVEVYGSHCGLAYNLSALLVIADRLAQPVGEWAPFEVPKPLRPLYPTATVYRVPISA